MQFFLILMLLGSQMMLTWSRPPRLEETNDSETAEVEYEGNDDTAADDYIREDQEPMMEEVQQKIGRREDAQQDSQVQGDARDSEIASDQQPGKDKDGYETLSDNTSGPRKERERLRATEFNGESGKDYISENERARKPQQIGETGNIAADDFHSHPHFNRPQKDVSVNGRTVDANPEYGELLFKMKHAQTLRQQNNIAEEAGVKPHIQQYYNNVHSKNRVQENENTINYERGRRQVKNVEDKQFDSTHMPDNKEDSDITNESSENAIIKNVKKLSEQDLEELLNSLPDDKKALLKKIMDKREITKKAGAVDESSYLEGGQSDTNKLGRYSVDSNTESSVTTSDTNKQPENSENVSSKSPDNENEPKGSASKSEIIKNTDVKNNEPSIRKETSDVDLKDDVSINSHIEEISKNEKRETNDLKNGKLFSEDSNISDMQLDDFSINDDGVCSENEDWLDTKSNEGKESNTHSDTFKREISQKQPLEMQNCVKSLEESFPAANSYDDNSLESEMAPLIRVKRTEKDHPIKKRDSSLLSNTEIHYAPRIESVDCENEEKSEFQDYEMFDRASNFMRNDQEPKSSNNIASSNDNTQRRYSQMDKSDSEVHPDVPSESHKKDKMSLGSDTDSVLSGIEGVDDNMMYNSGSRGKRTLESSDEIVEKLDRSVRTAGPINEAISDNSVIVSQYQDDEAFGPLPRNVEEDVSRFKRVRQVKDTQI